MSYADVSSGHHEVVDVARIKRAVGNRVRFDFQLLGIRLESVACANGFFRVMQIDGPSRGDAGIGKFFGSDNIVLAENHITEKAA